MTQNRYLKVFGLKPCRVSVENKPTKIQFRTDNLPNSRVTVEETAVNLCEDETKTLEGVTGYDDI